MWYPEKLKKQVHAALAGWHRNSEEPTSLLSHLQLVRSDLNGSVNSQQLRFVTNKVLQDGIDKLAVGNQEGAEILQRRFRDNDTIKRVAVSLHLSDDQVNRRQREAIQQLTDILLEQEKVLREKQATAIEGTLPIATYKQLFGFEEARQNIVESLVDPDGVGVVAVTGIGGIGKTAFADAVTRAVIRQFYFEKVIWLRVDPTTISGSSVTSQLILDIVSLDLLRKLLPELTEPLLRDERVQRIRYVLQKTPYLIVIDNVETDADTGMLMQHLNDWAGSSKFLVTTRTRLTGQTSTLSFALTELPKVDATNLVRHQATENGLHDFANDAAQVIDAIYEVTGGNPLALKLVVSLVSFMSLRRVLDNLCRGGKTDDVGVMYKRIYSQAWGTLKEDARDLLQAMPLVGEEGGSIEQLEAISELDNSAIWAAITDLVNRSLIEVRGDYKSRRYGVHRLTMTFLETEIITGDWGFD